VLVSDLLHADADLCDAERQILLICCLSRDIKLLSIICMWIKIP